MGAWEGEDINRGTVYLHSLILVYDPSSFLTEMIRKPTDRQKDRRTEDQSTDYLFFYFSFSFTSTAN